MAAALVPGVVLESRRKQPLVLAPAMGVHLTHHSRDHFIVENTTKVVSDRHHGGIRLAYKFNEVFATCSSDRELKVQPPHLSFRRGGVTIPHKNYSRCPPTQIRVDPYAHGVIISSTSFAKDYKLSIPTSDQWRANNSIHGFLSGSGQVTGTFRGDELPFLLRSASPMHFHPDDEWHTSDEDDDSTDLSDDGYDATFEPKPDPNDGIMGSARPWELRRIDTTCDRRVHTTKRDVSPIYVGLRSSTDREHAAQDRITGMAFSSAASYAGNICIDKAAQENKNNQLPLRLSRCYLTWESLHVIANRDGTVNRRPTLEFHFVYVLDDGSAPNTSLDAAIQHSVSNIEGEQVRCVVTYMISENEDALDLPLLDVLFGTPKFLEQVERQCSTKDTEREVSARSIPSLGDFHSVSNLCDHDDQDDQLQTLPSGSVKLVKMSSSTSNHPIRLARSFSGKLARQLSAEESHGVWRTLRQWELDFDFKLGNTPQGLYSLMNHEFTFLHYFTDHQQKPIDWFVADTSAPPSQIDALVRPIVNLRQRPYTVDKDQLLGIAHFRFDK